MITNYLSPLEFRVVVHGLPHVEFFTQKSAIPGVSASPTAIGSPFSKHYHSPDNLEFSNLNLSFIVDEKMLNYIEVFTWIQALTFPHEHSEFAERFNSDKGLYSDITLTILNSNKNANIEVTFSDCFPISLSDLSLDTTMADVDYPEATATFQYGTYKIKHINR